MIIYNPPHYRDKNSWDRIPDSELERLQRTLKHHSDRTGVKLKKHERRDLVNKQLKKQNYTCAFGKDVGGEYCWNAPKDNYVKKSNEYKELKYLKLQWGHIKPRCRNETQTLDDLCLLCARCNNQLQSSRHLVQLEKELESKLLHIKRFLRENNGC
jgi:hypothetical protein